MPHGLDTAIRTRHTVTAIYPAPRTVSAGLAGDDAQVVVMPRRDARPVRDGHARCGAIVPLDAQKRVSLGKVFRALGWDETTSLVATCEPGTVIVRAAAADSPFVAPVPVDADRRLTLPPVVIGALVSPASLSLSPASMSRSPVMNATLASAVRRDGPHARMLPGAGW